MTTKEAVEGQEYPPQKHQALILNATAMLLQRNFLLAISRTPRSGVTTQIVETTFRKKEVIPNAQKAL